MWRGIRVSQQRRAEHNEMENSEKLQTSYISIFPSLLRNFRVSLIFSKHKVNPIPSQTITQQSHTTWNNKHYLQSHPIDIRYSRHESFNREKEEDTIWVVEQSMMNF